MKQGKPAAGAPKPARKPKPTKAEIRDKNRAVGRPPKYATPEEMEEGIKAYFNEMLMAERPPTLAGLALFLGFLDVMSLYDQESRKEYGAEFSYAVKKAVMKIQSNHEERLFGGNPTGSIFWLKTQAGWKETQVSEHTGSVIIVDNIP
jgi:hypothetical protein